MSSVIYNLEWNKTQETSCVAQVKAPQKLKYGRIEVEVESSYWLKLAEIEMISLAW